MIDPARTERTNVASGLWAKPINLLGTIFVANGMENAFTPLPTNDCVPTEQIVR
jgi:hypothetical protein